LPDAAKGTSEASAKAFVRHYVELINYAMRTGRTKPLRPMRAAGCRTCTAIESRILAVYRNGGRLEGAGWSVLGLSIVRGTPQAHTLVSAGISIAEQSLYESPSASPSHSTKSRGHLDFHLTSQGDEWIVSRLDATQ
jgi:hypothetical protein